MNESTARAERYDLQTSTSSFFFWEVAEKPLAVKIPYELMDRLEREAVDSFRSVTSKGSEIGGLLVGQVVPGSPMVVSVAEYQLIDCDYARGPLYRLSDADLLRFQRAIEQRLAAGEGIAGFFRTHTRKGISLDPDDVALMDAQFRDPHQFALLVRPFATKASTAGIFIREGGKISGDASPLEFPFRSPASESKPADATEGRPAPAAAAAPQAQAPKPAVRAQIVPIASRREIALPGGLEDGHAPEVPVAAAPAAVTPPAAPAVEDKPAPKVEAKAAQVDVKPETKAAAKTEPKPPVKTEAKAAVKVEPKPEAAPPVREVEKTVAPAMPAVATEAAPRSTKGLKLVLAALFAMVLFVVLFVYPGLMRQSSKTPEGTQADGSPLQLRVERTNGELLLTWNRDSEVIRGATKAVLTINDGAQHESVEMDLAQLRNGSIVYSPQTADISFKMEVIGKDVNKTASESVRVLRTRPSALQETPVNAAGTPAPPVGSTPAQPAATPAATDTAQTAPETEAVPEPKPVQATKAFNAQSLSARLRPAQAGDLPDAPTVAGAGIASAQIPRVNLNNLAATPLAPAPVAPRPSAPSAQAPARTGGQIQQAVLISKKDPVYPKLARQTGARGAVRLTATVGKDGRVKAVKVVSGHPMLQAAAVEAVKQWIYKPTLLNGQPVETETEIVLNFVGDR